MFLKLPWHIENNRVVVPSGKERGVGVVGVGVGVGVRKRAISHRGIRDVVQQYVRQILSVFRFLYRSTADVLK